MKQFEEFAAETERNNAIIQRALAEIDFAVLATALIGVGADGCAPFYRNLSRRAHQRCERDVELRQTRTSAPEIEAAQQVLLQLLRRNAELAPAPFEPAARTKPPQLRVERKTEIVETFSALAAYTLEHGFLALEELADVSGHPIMRKGLELLSGGWDPLDVRDVLERSKQAYLLSVETKLNMILDGIASLQSGDTPEAVTEKLQAYVEPE